MIRALATEQTDRQVADTLNARGLRSGTGHSFRRLVIRHIRKAYGIPGLAEHLRSAVSAPGTTVRRTGGPKTDRFA